MRVVVAAVATRRKRCSSAREKVRALAAEAGLGPAPPMGRAFSAVSTEAPCEGSLDYC
jgi:hypothetical protein